MNDSTAFDRGSLGDLRVLEIGTSVAAPMATQILGDLGAEVIKIERVGRGDDSRNWAPPHWEGISVTFLSLNRNKRSVALDFKQERGRAILEQLISSADVLIQNLRPGAFAAAGFSADRIRELNPRLIYCEMTGFGPVGPRAGQPAYDPLLQAYSGIVSITGEDGGPPARVPVSLLDMGTGMWAALAVYESLRRRDRTGVGTHVEVSLLQTALAWLTMPLMGVLAGNPPPGRLGSGLAAVVPYGAFPTLDGYVFVSAGNNELWFRLCRALGEPQLHARSGFESNESRVHHRREVTDEISRLTREHDTALLLERLSAEGVPCSPVNTLDHVVIDEQVQATGVVTRSPHRDIDDFSIVNLPITFDRRYPDGHVAPPNVGEQTAEVLMSLGMSVEAIGHLQEEGVIGMPTSSEEAETSSD